jgi:hypothetical protein
MRTLHLYITRRLRLDTQMIDKPLRATALALHHLTVVLGIALLPLALMARKAGVHLPFERAIKTTERAYRRVSSR